MPPKIFTTEALQANQLKRGQKVKLVTDIAGVPAGTEGKVAMANGFTWYRYWVRFADGQVLGHIDHSNLVRSKHFERFVVARDREAEQAKLALEQAALGLDVAAETASEDSADGGGDPVVNGVAIPMYLLERSAEARARLGA